MKLSTPLVLLGSTAALAAPSAVRRQAGTVVNENGSFESGTTGWTLTGPASIVSNEDGNSWGFTATDGSHFAILSSTNGNLKSSISTPVSGLKDTQQSLSFDWKLLTIRGGRGPPQFTCTLKTSLYSGMTVQSWTRKAIAGGAGTVQETFVTGTSGGDILIEFECAGDGSVFNSGVAIDNVKWSGIVA